MSVHEKLVKPVLKFCNEKISIQRKLMVPFDFQVGVGELVWIIRICI